MVRKRGKWPPEVVAGCAGLACVCLVAALLVLVLSHSERARPNACLRHIKQSVTAVVTYAADHDDRLPPADSWMDGVQSYAGKDDVLACPDVRSLNPTGYGYAMNAALSSAKVGSVPEPADMAVLFDSVHLERNASSGFSGFPDPERRSHNHVAFLDCHASYIDVNRASEFGPDGRRHRPTPVAPPPSRGRHSVAPTG